MADFHTAHKITAKNEGGYTGNPDDNGNWTGGKKGAGKLIGTNWGISAPVLVETIGRLDSSKLGRIPTVEDMKNLSRETAEAIYKLRYWDKIKGDQIISQAVANSIYDSAVNMGVGTAIKLAQRAAGIAETGVMDTATLNKLNNK